ncbi:uncharacterized protein [Prorops nasuta]|uniref:uncharacterized protein n=1 Tax=Prorops nasuta TaxID=863751 RepID=UPI0034CDDB9B
MIPVRISTGARWRVTFALLDDGSTITLVDKRIITGIGIVGMPLKLTMRCINDRAGISLCCEQVSFKISGELEEYSIRRAMALDELGLPTQTLDADIVRYIAKRESIFKRPYGKAKPDILIGQDSWQLIATVEMRAVKDSELAITLKPLGWVVHCVYRYNIKKGEEIEWVQVNEEEADGIADNAMDDLIKEYFAIEDFGAKYVERRKKGDRMALDILEQTTRKRGDGSWETGLLWKSGMIPKIDSKATVMRDLILLEKRLDNNNVYADLFYEEMRRLIDADKPGRVRIVQNASKKTQGWSLNDQLEAGPDLLNSLPGVMIRFRLFAVAVVADIKDMYMRVHVRKEDCSAQRFLWRGRNRKRDPDVYEMTRLIFGAKSPQGSAIYVKDKNADLFVKEKPDAVESIKEDSYADDFLSSRPMIEEATRLVRDVISVNSCANFEMHGWASNESEVMTSLPKEGQGEKWTTSSSKRLGKERVLGMFWKTTDDILGFNVNMGKIPKAMMNGKRKPTKHEFLKIIMSIYDPLGLLSPFTVKSKILLQEIWRSGIGWDETIRDEEFAGWINWVKNLRELNEYYVPRCLTPKGNNSYSNVQLHAFADASSRALAGAIYLRITSPDAKVHVMLVMGKSRIAPMKPLSIPRLELQVAVIAARLLYVVEKEITIKIDERVLWSDSVTVIRWIKSDQMVRQSYVAHRLGEISELSKGTEWRWVPTKINPADRATRWKAAGKEENDTWLTGPDFLKNQKCEWPVQTELSEERKKEIDRMEMRKAMVFCTRVRVSEMPITVKIFEWKGLLTVARRIDRTIQAESFSEEVGAIRKGIDQKR